MNSFGVWLEGVGGGVGQLYHVTMIRKLPSIRRIGLYPNFESVYSHGGYAAHSKGKVFLTNLEGVDYWKNRMSDMEFHSYDDPMGVAVLTIDVSGLDVERDELGSEDSGHGAYYVKGKIGRGRIKKVEMFPED
jgi:hypothetical protein